MVFDPMVSRKRKLLGILCCLVLLSISAAAADKLLPLRPVKADIPPVIDGILDDPVWKQAPSETGFKTYSPDYGKEMVENTVVYYAYDQENIYFAFRCYDSQPDKIKASVSSRDKIQTDDWICINLDSFNDQQSLYAFYVNPLGIQGDSRFEGGEEDFSVDVVWYSEGKIDAEGYAIELRIPFKSIRFSHREPVEMGVIYERKISRLSGAGTYPLLDPVQGGNFLTQTRTIIFSDVKHYTRDWIVMLGLQDISSDFSTEVGYLSRDGLTRFRSGAVRMFHIKSKVLQRIDPLVHSFHLWDKYSGLYEKIRWEIDQYVDSDRFLETKRGFFFKASFLWRL